MTNAELTLENVFINTAKFAELMNESKLDPQIEEVMKGYSNHPLVRISNLTQNYETFLNTVGNEDFDLNKDQYLIWTVTSEKAKILKAMDIINKKGTKGLNIFVFKAFLNGNKISFECLLKPTLNTKTKRTVNTETPVKQLQNAYWEVYFAECDAIQSDMQVTPKPRHYQNVSIGKKGVQILQTINTQSKYVASEIAINDNKEIFNTLYEHKEEIEKEVGELEWDSKENNKSAKIRKIFPIDINDPKNHEKAAKEHIKMAEELKAIAYKYL